MDFAGWRVGEGSERETRMRKLEYRIKMKEMDSPMTRMSK
jgi:hypothetical protein